MNRPVYQRDEQGNYDLDKSGKKISYGATICNLKAALQKPEAEIKHNNRLFR